MKILFSAKLDKFDTQGEKTGWTFILIPAKVAVKLKPGNKKSFRVKGKLDEFSIGQVALMPMGEGDFIMAINAAMRKGINKQKGATVEVSLEADDSEIPVSPELMECLADDPAAMRQFEQLSGSHKKYYSRWIESAKTLQTKTKRIAVAVKTLASKMNYGEMIKSQKRG